MSTSPRSGPTTQTSTAASSGGHDSGQRDENETLEWESQERVEPERDRLVGPDQGGPHEQKGEDRERCGERPFARAVVPCSGHG